MKRILTIALILSLSKGPLVLNAMEGANTTNYCCDGDVEFVSSMRPEIVDNDGVPLPWKRNPYVFGNYQIEFKDQVKDPVTRMNSLEYSVKTVDDNKVLASGIAQAAFNTVFLRRLNEEAQLKIKFTNK